MLHFFRKIRYNLTQNSQFYKYLKYAIGEIFLVMIGILLALQVNNWNENRKNRIKEQHLYQALTNVLKSDLEDIVDKIANVEESLEAQEIFITNSFDDIKNNYDSKQLNDLFLAVRRSSRSFFPNYGLYDRISANDQLDMIQSPQLQMEIIELYEQHYRRYNDIDLNLEELAVFSLFNNYFSKIEDNYISNDKRYDIGFDTLESDYDILKNECRKIHYLTTLAHSSMLRCKSEIENVLSSIKSEMK